VALFNRLDGFAAAGFLPVALWLAYAGALNFEIWRTN
jgi:tryptophan-rich sensory protein